MPPRAALFSVRALLAAVLLALTASWAYAQTPYHGHPAPIPGGIQAEDFDHGGQGVAYYDDSPGNSGGTYRWTDVDVEPTNSGGAAVSWIRAGEWLRYTVNVSQSGNYYVNTRVASVGSGGSFHIEFKGQDKTGALRVPNTGGWRAYQDLGTTVYLEAGVQEMRIVFDSNGGSGFVGNLSYLSFSFQGASTAPAPGPTSPSGGASAYGGSAHTLPGGVQAEDFDHGGNGVGYNDHTPGNAGGAYRSTDVDIAPTSSGGYAVGWIGAGEWLRYTVNVTSAGQYTINLRVASAGSGGTFHIEFNGQDKTGAIRVPNTGGWNNYQTVSVSASLESGVQAMRVVFDSNGSTGAVGNLSYMEFVKGTSSSGGTSGGGGGGGGGGRVRVMTWNIHFGHGDTWGQAQVIANSGADVVLLQEAAIYDEYMPNTYPARLEQLTGQRWYSVWAPHEQYGNSQGTLILSRLPIVAKSVLNAHGHGFGRAVVSVGGVNVTFLNAHLAWDNTSQRSAQLESLLDWGRQLGGARIVGGDFNSWWGEWWITRMESEYSDTWQDVTGSDENGYTLNGAVRFDYLFRSYDSSWRLQPTGCWVISTGKSDHSPVVADYTVQ